MSDVADLPAGALVVDGDEDPENQNPAVVVNTPPIPAAEWDVDDDTTVAEYAGNEPYPDSAPVVLVVYRDELAEWRPEFDGGKQIPAADLVRGPCYGYAFPAPRLEAVGHLDEHETGDEDSTDEPEADDEDSTDGPETDDEDSTDGPETDDEDSTDGPETDDEDSTDGPETDDEDSTDGPETGDTDPPLVAIADALRDRRVSDVRVVDGADVVECEKLGVTYHISDDGSVREGDRVAEKLEDIARDVLGGGEEVTV